MKVNRGEQTKLRKELEEENNIVVTKNAISKLVKVKDYRIHVTKKGNIKIPETVKALLNSGFGEHGKKVNETLAAKKGKPVERITVDVENWNYTGSDIDDPGIPIDPSKPLTLEADRKTIELHKAFQSAEKDRIANEVKLEKLIDIDDVSEKSFDLWRQVRESIQSIHDRCAIKIRATESDHEAEQILKEEETRILNSIVEGFASLDDSDLKKKLLLRLTR